MHVDPCGEWKPKVAHGGNVVVVVEVEVVVGGGVEVVVVGPATVVVVVVGPATVVVVVVGPATVVVVLVWPPPEDDSSPV